MSQAQLETQIQRKRTELDILAKDQLHLESTKHDLSEEYKERNENYERLRERLEQANQEIDMSEREILHLKSEIAAMQNYSVDDALDNEEAVASSKSKLSNLSPHDCINELMNEMAKAARLMENPSMKDSPGKDAGSGSLSGHDHGDGRPEEGLTQVTIHYERIQEFASFQLTPSYTFNQLCEDACRYWSINPEYGTLRDVNNVMWPPQATISAHLAERMSIDGQRPVIRLVSRQTGSAAVGSQNDILGSEGLRSRKAKLSGAAEESSGGDDSLADNTWMYDNDSAGEDDEDESLALIKEWRRMVNEEMSPFFHLPRYAGKQSKFRSINVSSKSAKYLSEKCATWCKLLLHAVFIFLVTLTLFHRRRVVTSFDAANSIRASLLETPFRSAQNFTSAQLDLNFERMRTVDDFWAWMQGPLIDTVLPRLDASGRLLSPSEREFSLQHNKILGGVRMRQYRTGSTLKTGGCAKSTVVLNDGVTIGESGYIKGRECFTDYSMDRQRLYVASLSGASFGVGGERGLEGFTYSRGSLLNSRPVVTHLSYFDRSSFAVELPPDRGRAMQMIWGLREGVWVDRRTRAVVLDFNVLNLNYYTMTVATVVVEFTAGGPIKTFHQFNTVTLSMVSSKAKVYIPCIDKVALQLWATFTRAAC